MMSNKRTTIQRIPREIFEDLDDALNWRFKNNLISRKDLHITEGFRLVRRMPEWSLAMNKIKMFPKKEDLNINLDINGKPKKK